MPLVPAKCPECGGNVVVDSEKDAWICDFCKTPFVVEKAINNFNTVNNITNNIKADTVNVYESNNKDFEIRGGVLEKYLGEAIDIVIPDNVIKIDRYAFANCSNIRSIKFNKGIKSIGEINGELLTKGLISGSSVKLNISEDAKLFSDCKELEKVELPEGMVSIGDGVFSGCRSLKEINFPTTVTGIGREAFYGTKLESVEINTTSLVIWENAFSYCRNLRHVKIVNKQNNSAKIDIKESAFSYCSELENVEISNHIANIGALAFAGCEKLQSLKIPHAEKINDNFILECRNLSEINLPHRVSNLKEHVITGLNSNVAEWLKAQVSKTVNVDNGVLTIPDGATSISYIGNHNEVKEIVIPGSVKYIEKDAFENFENLQTITLLQGVTHIEEGAFFNCNKLKKLVIPSSIERIDDCFEYDDGWHLHEGTNTCLEEIDIPEDILRKNIRHFFRGIINTPYMRKLNSNGKFCPRCGNKYSLLTQRCIYCGHFKGDKIDKGIVCKKGSL